MRPFCALIWFLHTIILNILEMSLCSGQKRVIYGEEVQNDELKDWNFLVALFRKNPDDDYAFYCGGAILNSRQILTAAHCILEPNRPPFVVVPGLNYTKIFIGEPNTWDQKGYQVQHVFDHEDYDDLTLVNDIAILTLTEPLDLSKYSCIDLEPYNYHPKSKL